MIDRHEALGVAILLLFVIAALAATCASAQPSMNQTPIESRLRGGRMSTTRQYAIDCYGGTACSVDGGVLRIWTADAGASSSTSGPPIDGGFVLWGGSVGSSNERILSNGTNTTIDTATPGQVQVDVTGVVTGTAYQTVEDEGVALTQRSTVNFTGAGVSCTDSGGKTVCTISGGGAGSVNTASGVASFDGGALDAYTTVTAAWASGASVILCRPTGEEASVEGLQVTVTSQSAGSFVVRSEPRQGTHWGDLPFVCVGN